MQQKHEAEDDAGGKSLSAQLDSRGRLRAGVVLALTVIAVYVCYLLAVPFLPALTWALALAILAMPAQRWLEAKLTSRSVSAFVAVIAIGLIGVVPMLWLGRRLLQDAASGATLLSEMVAAGEWRELFEDKGPLAPVVTWLDAANLDEAFRTVASWLTTFSASFVSSSLLGIITFVLTFYLLFYFLRDRTRMLGFMRDISPLSPAQTETVFRRVKDIVYATVYGTVVVAIVQGSLGGLAFWWLGLPAPILWGTVMGLLALVPVLGAFVIWIPAALLLALGGHWEKAVVLIAWGSVVVGGIDNLLYPMLVGRRLRLHTIPTFIAILGGITVFGAAGLLLGPMIVAVTMSLLQFWSVKIDRDGPATAAGETPNSAKRN